MKPKKSILIVSGLEDSASESHRVAVGLKLEIRSVQMDSTGDLILFQKHMRVSSWEEVLRELDQFRHEDVSIRTPELTEDMSSERVEDTSSSDSSV